MRSFWTEPFLWIHLAGIAALPLALELVWLGLAVGDPIFPVWLELALVMAIGSVPVLWMQLTRPFDIFSILVLAIKSEQLTTDQLRLLRLFKTKTNQVVAVGAAFFMGWVLWSIYRDAPIAAAVAPLSSGWRIAGLLGAGMAFLISNLFLQVPLSVAQVLLTSESEFSATKPYSSEEVSQDFTMPGIQVKQILPFSLSESATSTPPQKLSSEQK